MHRLACALFLVAALLHAQAPAEVEITSEPYHHLLFENEYVRVFKVEVAPHQATLLHRHRHDYIFVTLGASDVFNAVEGKPGVRVYLQDGETRFVPRGSAHAAQNRSSTPLRSIIVELLQDESVHRAPPPKGGEARGLQILNGGTQDILFVQDGVRVSEIDLQPGGMMPSHHHNRPHLLVAITDLEIRSDVGGMGPMPGHFQSGDVKWLPGGYTHRLMNVGKQTAKFVTLEFP